MAAKLTTEQEQAAKEFLDEVNRIRTEKNQSTVAWSEAVKFLVAGKFEVKRALTLFENHQCLREREGLVSISPTDPSVRRELLTGKFTILSSRDSQGAAIALFTAREHKPPQTTHQAVLQGLVFQLDTALQSNETQTNGLVFIYDMTGSKYSNFDYDLSIKLLNMLKGGYPARLKKVLIVTAPLWFTAPFEFLRLFIKEKLRDRVHRVKMSELPKHIPLDALPEQLGGTLEIKHKEWLEHCLKQNDRTMDQNMLESFLNFPDTREVMCTGTVNGNNENNVISDLDSEESKETISEKHNHEEREKEVEEENGEKGKRALPDQGKKQTGSLHIESPPCKRAIDSNPSSPTEGLPPPLPRKKRTSALYEDDSIHNSTNKGLTIDDFVESVKQKTRNGLYREYAMIKAEPPAGTFNASRAKPNLAKNRYTDVLCLDDTRVPLSLQAGDQTSDYINANFVDGYKQKNAFISTQGPLPKTFADFWRMIWEQQVLVIVMTTKTVERSRLKCGQYWPNEEDTMGEYGDFEVINTGIELKRDYTASTLVIQNVKTEETREVTHFQFTSWPDYGVPHTAAGFLDFLFHVRQHQEERTSQLDNWQGHPLGPPIVVHCSAGIGRTGTFCTMDISTKRLADDGKIDIEGTVRRIRSQRAFSIQMPDQYVFCHLALLEHAQNEGLLGDDLDLEGFDDSESESD